MTIQIYTHIQQGQKWLRMHQGRSPTFACILGFTETGLIDGISAAGATPQDRQYTAIADAEFLINGCQLPTQFPLPPLEEGASPVFISRAVVELCQIPVRIFNAGLPRSPTVQSIDLGGIPAKCLTTGQALPIDLVRHLWQEALTWGKKLAESSEYLIIGECVVGGTTTALAVLTALGIDGSGKVNSSHPRCNHFQKSLLVNTGLQAAGLSSLPTTIDPLAIVAAVGDPMQIVAAGMAIAASRQVGVMLAGGTQMLAVYALISAIVDFGYATADLEKIVVGTTRWVAEDITGDTVGLARAIPGVPLLATRLNFASSRYPQFRVYEQGYVKEGVGAGGCAIAAHLNRGYTSIQLVKVIEKLFAKYRTLRFNSAS